MRADPKQLDGASFDVLVVGGGIQGAAMAREAAMRGASVLLVEARDFGSGTSSQSSRLVHGGLRYLEHGQLRLVKEALHERERLLRLAPHLVRPQPMLMPFFDGGSKRPWVVKMGLKLYDFLARGSLPKARSHSADECRRMFPRLRSPGLRGGAVFYDARTVDQRLTLAVIEQAHDVGAQLLHHAYVAGVGASGSILIMDKVMDLACFVRARHVINATGPHVDGIRRLLGIEGPDLVRTSRGSHVVLDAIEQEMALAAFLPDRRIQFVIPHPDGTVCGTTEDEDPDIQPDHALPAADLAYLLDALGFLLEAAPDRNDVRYGYTGWRALPTGNGPAGGASREAFLEVESSPVGPIHSVVGGKLTTHRAFAERAIRDVLGCAGPSPTRTAPLPGGDGPHDFGEPLWWRHGSRAPQIRALAAELARPDLLEPICPHRDLLRVEAVHALRSQSTLTFADLLRRRLFHSQGPCLNGACLDDTHALFTEFLPEVAHAGGGYVPDPVADKAGLRADVQRDLGALYRP